MFTVNFASKLSSFSASKFTAMWAAISMAVFGKVAVTDTLYLKKNFTKNLRLESQ